MTYWSAIRFAPEHGGIRHDTPGRSSDALFPRKLLRTAVLSEVRRTHDGARVPGILRVPQRRPSPQCLAVRGLRQPLRLFGGVRAGGLSPVATHTLMLLRHIA